MTLRVALVIDGEMGGAKKALENTKRELADLDESAGRSAESVDAIGGGFSEVASSARKAGTELGGLETTVSSVGGAFGTLKANALGALGGLAGGIVQAGLDAAFSAAMGAAKTYFDETTNSASNIADELDAHAELIDRIKGKWTEAEGAASDYGATTLPGLLSEAQDSFATQQANYQSEAARLRTGHTLNVLPFGYSGAARAPLEGLTDQLRADLSDGMADIVAFRAQVDEVLTGLPLDDPARGFGRVIKEETQLMADAQIAMEQAMSAAQGILGDQGEMARLIGEKAAEAGVGMADAATQTDAWGASATSALPALREMAAIMDQLKGGPISTPNGGSARLNIGGGFAGGGWTGDMPTDQIAGFVHGREYVFDADTTARIGVSNLDAIRRGVRGYAEGGWIGPIFSTSGLWSAQQ